MTEYKRGDKVIVNGNKEAIVQDLYYVTDEGIKIYNVRLWDCMRHVGDIVQSGSDLKLRIEELKNE